MTNYERIQIDKAFCAYVVMGAEEDATFDEAMAWLDTEQAEARRALDADTSTLSGAKIDMKGILYDT